MSPVRRHHAAHTCSLSDGERSNSPGRST
jgi:hypothetical protein